MAGMPVHDLLGGKTRKACPVYVHADGNLPSDEGDESKHFTEARELMSMGFRHIRLQYNGYGANIPTDSKVERPPGASDGPTDQDSTYDPLSCEYNAGQNVSKPVVIINNPAICCTCVDN